MLRDICQSKTAQKKNSHAKLKPCRAANKDCDNSTASRTGERKRLERVPGYPNLLEWSLPVKKIFNGKVAA